MHYDDNWLYIGKDKRYKQCFYRPVVHSLAQHSQHKHVDTPWLLDLQHNPFHIHNNLNLLTESLHKHDLDRFPYNHTLYGGMLLFHIFHCEIYVFKIRKIRKLRLKNITQQSNELTDSLADIYKVHSYRFDDENNQHECHMFDFYSLYNRLKRFFHKELTLKSSKEWLF